MHDARVGDVGEHALLDRIRALVPPAPPWVVAGIGDDAAVVERERNTLDVLTVDGLVEGVHFDWRFTSPADVGYKALAVNLSDLAAMGAAPRAALLSLALPGEMRVEAVEALVRALIDLGARHGVALVGGNIARSPAGLVVDVTATGAVKRRRVLTRAGAKPGDELYVSGAIGASAAGLEWLRERAAREAPAPAADPALERCGARHRRPEPRVRLGTLLGRTRAATACVDLSDGLGDAVHQLAHASGVGARIAAADVPVDDGARAWFERRGADPLDAAIRGGEDYELLFSVSKKARGRFRGVRRLIGDLPVTRIGAITADRAVVLDREGELTPLPGGFVHF